MSQQGLHRWGPLAGPLFLVLFVAGFIVSGNSPDPDASSAKIVRYLQSTSNFHKNVVTLFILLAAIMAMIVFFAALRSRLAEAEGGIGSAAALAYGAGITSAVLLFIGICIFISPVISAHDAPRHALDPGIYRLTQDLGYPLWVASAVIGALAVWATSAVAFRTGMLPRWYAWVGIVVGVICLPAVLFFPIFLYYLWIVLTGILLFLRRPVSAAAPEAVGSGGHGP